MEGHTVDLHQEGNCCSSHVALGVQIVQKAPQHLWVTENKKKCMDVMKNIIELCRSNATEIAPYDLGLLSWYIL